MEELRLDIEVLEERIAPDTLTVTVPANPHADAHPPTTVPPDGATPLDLVCRKVGERFGQPISTETLKLFVDRLQQLGFLESGTAAGQQSRAEPGRISGDLFYLRLKAFDPDRLFTRLLPHVRFCFTPAFLACATALILFAFGLTLIN